MERIQTFSGHLKEDLHTISESEQWKSRVEVGVLGNSSECAIKLETERNQAYVPVGYLADFPSKDSGEVLSILQFLLQKDILGQDSFLIGPPGCNKRRLAMAYCEMAGREVEYLSISQDTTVSDIKQRREILAGTARFEDSSAVRAAIHGRVLILEGVEKAERNVLSTLNNLLENREMSLEDGRFLTNPKRFDSIHADLHREDVQLVRVSHLFRVICLGVPVPRFEGNPLDPPFRSRFQALEVSYTADSQTLLSQQVYLAKCALDSVSELEGVSSLKLMRNSIPHEFDRVLFPLLTCFPEINPRFALSCLFPFPQLPNTDPAHRSLCVEVFQRFALLNQESRIGKETDEDYRDRVLGPKYSAFMNYVKLSSASTVDFQSKSSGAIVSFPQTVVPLVHDSNSNFVPNIPYQDEILNQMLALYCVKQHHAQTNKGVFLFTLLGNRGVGKTCLLKRFAQQLQLRLILFPLHRDMSAQDLFQRRGTLENGDTVWFASPLLQALEMGSLLVLDNAECLPAAILVQLSSLLTDGTASLPDGSRILPRGSKKLLATDRVCHDMFQIVCVGRPVPADNSTRNWISAELLSCCMPFLWIRPLTIEEEKKLLYSTLPAEEESNKELTKLCDFACYVRDQRDDPDLNLLSLSTRQLLRIAKRLLLSEGKENLLGELIRNTCLWRFLPILTRTSLDAALVKCGIVIDDGSSVNESLPPPLVSLFPAPVHKGERFAIGTLTICEQTCDILLPRNEHERSLIPDTYFVENVRQTRILSNMLSDYLLGSHLLLMGNQGTGKNKLVDRLLHLLQLPREYVQLDRDTTVGGLTSQPVVEHGVLRFEDSPLVKACRFGRILVIDEADKAPTHVTAVLKSLLSEDGEMLLADGRRLVANDSNGIADGKSVIQVHPDFRAIVLANRVGFPFLGNDFFRETGDIFAPHTVENPDETSEIALLKEYAPSVPEETLRKLTKAFQELRQYVVDGKLLYPYSTRELVNTVKHMERFPKDGIAQTMQNVFDFDRYAVEDRKTISTLFERYGIPIGMHQRFRVKTGDVIPLPEPILTEAWKQDQPASSPEVLRFVMHSLPWKLLQPDQPYFPMHSASSAAIVLNREEHRANTFDEQVFSFKLPLTEMFSFGVGVLGSCLLPGDRLVVASNDAHNALRLYVLNSRMDQFSVFDLSIPHFNFNGSFIAQVKRPAPTRATLFALPGNNLVGLFAHDDQWIFVVDLEKKRFKIVAVDAVVFRTPGGSSPASGSNVYAERMRIMVCTDLCARFGVLLLYQQHSSVILLYDLIHGQVRITIQLPPSILVFTLEVTSANSFLIRTENGLVYVLDASTSSSSNNTSSATTFASTSLVVSGTLGLVYTSFSLLGLNVHTLSSEELHGKIPVFVSPHPLVLNELRLEQHQRETHFMRSSGTVCQTVEGLNQSVQSVSQEALVKSYLRTSQSSSRNIQIVAHLPIQVGTGGHQMASLFVKPKAKRALNGYLGYDVEGTMEVVDMKANTLRHVLVQLPETNKRRGTVHDKIEEEPEEEEEEEDIETTTTMDELNVQVLKQRAPYVFLFALSTGDVLTLDRTGQGRIFQVDQDRLESALEHWKQIVGEKNNNEEDLDVSGDEEEEGEDGEDEAEDGDDQEEEEEEDAPDEPNRGSRKPQGSNGKKTKKKTGSSSKNRKGGGKSGKRNQKKGSGGGKGRGSGSGSGDGEGSGNGGGEGQGMGSGGGTSLPEPGQFKGPRPLTGREKTLAQERLEELKRLTRYFPDDKKLQKEMENLEARLEESEDFEREQDFSTTSAEDDARKAKIEKLQKRLQRVETELKKPANESNTRLQAEAKQLRATLNQLLEQDAKAQSGQNGSGSSGGGRRNNNNRSQKIDDEARKQARKLEKEAWKEVLDNLEANPQDAALYQRYKDSVAMEIRELRATLDQMQAKKNERVWLNNKDVGDLDDRKLVDGLTGERNIYKRRGERPPDPFAFQQHPKRLTFLFDVSSSMSRYAMDGRLERSLEAATMAMEAFKGHEHKFAWKFRGHSGSTDDVVFVEPGKYPRDDTARLEVLRQMNAHSETCGSGDNTMEATRLAIREITKEQGDEYFTILFSDANIEQYDITPADLKALLTMDERVNVFIVFIGSMGTQALRLRAELPQDRVFVTLSTSQIPAVLKRIFLSSVLKE